MSDSTVWVEVKREGLWKPNRLGDELVGAYGGIQMASGPSGAFECAEVRTDSGAVYGVSGVQAISLLRAAGLRDGERIKLVYDGDAKPSEPGRSAMRKFRLYVAARGPWRVQLPKDVRLGEPPPVDPADPGPTPPPTDAFGRNTIEPDLD